MGEDMKSRGAGWKGSVETISDNHQSAGPGGQTNYEKLDSPSQTAADDGGPDTQPIGVAMGEIDRRTSRRRTQSQHAQPDKHIKSPQDEGRRRITYNPRTSHGNQQAATGPPRPWGSTVFTAPRRK
ncbi:hypothetical protein SLA2020_495400 [Shorea laevis]